MKVVGSFNKVSEKLKKELIRTAKPNEVLRFQLLGGHFEPAIGREGFGAARSIRLNDRIYDPYQTDTKGAEVGGYVDIGVPDTIKEGRVEKCKKYWVHAIAGGIPGNGQFALMGGNVEDMEIAEFLFLSNGNPNNPHRDKSKEALYEIVDAKAILEKEKQSEEKELRNKLKRFAKNNPEKAAEFIGLLQPKTEATDNT
jgi:hypothetical protein